MKLARFLLSVVLCWFVRPAQAIEPSKDNPHIYVWLLLRGCTPDAGLQQAVVAALTQHGYPATALHPPRDWQTCEGSDCARRFQSQCTSMPFSAIIGGKGEQRGRHIVYTMWLHDLTTGKTGYLDNYCPECDLGKKMAQSAVALVERPGFGPHAPVPFCQDPNKIEYTPALPPINKVHFVAFGEGRHKSAIADAMEAAIRPTGIKPVPITVHAKDYNNPDLIPRIVTKGQPEQILLAEALPDGKVDMTIYDARTGQSDAYTVECPGCDKDEMANKVRIATGILLDRCTGIQCGPAPMIMPAPNEVCQPFAVCGNSTDLAASSTSHSTSLSVDALRRHRIVNGLAWGAVGAAALTAGTLFAIDAANPISRESPQAFWRHELVSPAWALLGATALGIAVAVPTTIFFPPSPRAVTNNQPTFICPR